MNWRSVARDRKYWRVGYRADCGAGRRRERIRRRKRRRRTTISDNIGCFPHALYQAST
jgi:hypothetical protein